MKELLPTPQELEHLGVGFISLNEALDLTRPIDRAMAALLAIFAGFEREIVQEQVRAGLAHARQNGKGLGRPATAALRDFLHRSVTSGKKRPGLAHLIELHEMLETLETYSPIVKEPTLAFESRAE